MPDARQHLTSVDGERIDLSQARFRRRSGRKRTFVLASGQEAPARPTLEGRHGPLRILGVDTALRTTGYGVVDFDGRGFRVVDCGVIKTAARQPLSQCLRRLAAGIRELARQHTPDVASIEGSFYFENVRTAMTLGAARGAVIASLAELDVPIYEYAPRRVKQAVCGYGNASKQQVTLLMTQLMRLGVEAMHHDTTDALALAVCHAQTAVAVHGLIMPKPL